MYIYNKRITKTKSILTASILTLGLLAQPLLTWVRTTPVNAAPTKVSPANMNGWTKYYSAPSRFVATEAPLGSGALELSAITDDDVSMHWKDAANTSSLASNLNVHYSTKRLAGPAHAAPAYAIVVDPDGDSSTSDGYYAIYKPAYNDNGTENYDSWNTWTITAASNFWYTDAYGTKPVGAVNYTPLNNVLAATPNATVIAAVINIGSDNAGWAVLVDNVKTTDGVVYDFEPQLHNFNVSVAKFHNRNGDAFQSANEELLAGWTMRLYKETPNGWELRDTKTTKSDGRVSFATQNSAGTYHVCEVKQLGWTQTKQDRNGTAYHVITDNQSPNKSEEGPYCRSGAFANTGNSSMATYIGNRHNDQTGNNQLNLSGIVFNNSNRNNRRDAGETILPNWTLRLYKEDTAGTWQRVGETSTRASDNKYAFTQTEAGVYHVCLVNQSGWQQVRQDWSGTPHHIVTANLSGASDEGEFCATAIYDDSTDISNAKYFGVTDIVAPTVTISTPTEGQTLNTISTAHNLTVNGVFTDNIAPNYVHVQLVDSVGNDKGVTTDYGNAAGTFSVQLSTSGLADGVYRIYAWGTDFAGNVSDRETSVRSFVLDNTAPTVLFVTPDSNNQSDLKIDIDISDDNLGQIAFEVRGPDGLVLLNTSPLVAGSTTERLRGFDLCANDRLRGCQNADLLDGSYRIRAFAYDTAGNRNISVSRSIIINRNTGEVLGDDTESEDNKHSQPSYSQTPAPTAPSDLPTPNQTPPLQGGQGGDTFDNNSSRRRTRLAVITSTPTLNTVAQGAEATTSTPGVLGAETVAQTNVPQDDNIGTGDIQSAEIKGCTKLLGICWYWWLLTIPVAAIIYWAYRSSRDEDK